MSYYDRAGRRVPTPRHDIVPSKGATIAVVLVALVLIVGIGVWSWMGQREVIAASKAAEQTEHLVTHDSMTAVHTYNGETIRFYVMTDPDTGVQYIVNDRGGMCLRENPDAT